MTNGKIIALSRWTFVGKVNMLSRLVITFPPRSKCLLIWLQSPSAVILEPKKIKPVIVSPSICQEVMGLDAMIFIFWMLSFKPAFLLSSFTFIKRLFRSSLLSAIRVVSSTYLRLFQLVLALPKFPFPAKVCLLRSTLIPSAPYLSAPCSGLHNLDSMSKSTADWATYASFTPSPSLPSLWVWYHYPPCYKS